MFFAIQELFDSHTHFIMGIVVAITLYITFTQTGAPTYIYIYLYSYILLTK